MDIFINQEFYNFYQKCPLKLVDIGASGGLSDNWRKAKKYLRFIGFEPQEQDYLRPSESSLVKDTFINKALYQQRATIDFHWTKKPGVSSIFAPDYEFLKQFPEAERFKISKTVKIEADCLDSQLAQRQITDVDFIKLDTQGSELLILKGAIDTLASVSGLEIEVEFSPLYKDQPLFSDVDKFVRSLGFQLFDLKPCYWKRKLAKKYGGLKGQLIFADALYLLKLDVFKQRLNGIEGGLLRKSKLLRAIAITLLYGYLDYAAAIFELGKDAFSSKEKRIFYQEIKKHIVSAVRLPYFPGRGRIATLFKKLYSVFRHHHNEWSIAEEFLGNLD